MAKKIIKPENLHIKVVKTANNDLKFDESQGLLTLGAAGSFLVTVKELAEYVQQVDADNSERINRDKGLYAKRANEGWSKEKLDENWQYNNTERSAVQDRALEESAKTYADVNWAWVIAPKEIMASQISHNKYFSKGIGKYNKKTRILETRQSINFPEFLEGGGMCYLEAFFPDKAVGRPPNGIYVNAIGVPSFVRTFWTDMEGNEISADTEIAFGSRVQLHIYTAGLYGQEIEIGLMDKDKISFDDCLLYGGQKSFYREVSVHLLKGNEVGKSGVSGLLGPVNDQEKAKNYVQKSVVDVWVDFSWIQQGGNNLEIYPLVKSKKNEKELKVQQSVKLKVSLNGKQVNFVQEYSNNPAMVDNVETDIASFLPCGYEAIFYQYGSNQEIEVFNEKKPVKITSGSFEGAAISVVAPPKGSPNIKKLYVRLDKVSTNDCLLEDANIGKNKKKLKVETHQGHVIDISHLQSAGIDTEIVVPDEQLETKLFYNYKYDKNSAWEFLKNYFLVSSALSNRDLFENQFKGILMDWEIESKHLINYYNIGLKTCSHQKDLHLKVYPDVAWAFHGFYNKPVNPRYYMDDKDIVKREGLDEEITWVQNYNQHMSFLLPMMPTSLTDSIQDFILELLKDMASNYGLAFTAYYDFKGEKCDKRIEYAERYPNLFDGIIAGAVTLEVLVQVLLLVLTEGASAELLLARMSKAGVRMSGKLATMAKKAERNIDAIRKRKLIGTSAKIAHTVITFPSISYYKGYRFVEHQTKGIQPLLEERIAFSPLLGIDHEHKKNLGDLIYERTPVYKIIDLSQKAFEGLTIGFNRHILKPFNKDLHEATGLSDHYMQLLGDSFGKVNEYLAFVTAELIEKVFGAKAEYSVNVKGGYGMDFELKLHNAEKKLNIIDFVGKGNVNDASEATIGSNKELQVEVKIDANVKVPVRAMNMINYMAKTNLENIEAGGKFEISTGIFVERRYFFHASEKKPYYKDSVIFTGVVGEYEYKAKVEKQGRKGRKEDIVNVEQKSKKFVLIPSQIITHEPIPLSEYKFTI